MNHCIIVVGPPGADVEGEVEVCIFIAGEDGGGGEGGVPSLAPSSRAAVAAAATATAVVIGVDDARRCEGGEEDGGEGDEDGVGGWSSATSILLFLEQTYLPYALLHKSSIGSSHVFLWNHHIQFNRGEI